MICSCSAASRASSRSFCKASRSFWCFCSSLVRVSSTFRVTSSSARLASSTASCWRLRASSTCAAISGPMPFSSASWRSRARTRSRSFRRASRPA
ncbi:MAG: hypothetical protein ACK56F_14415, partial [bacterium]